ncbi:MAG: hypothetical protein WD467_02025 [Candidatus Saccharimonadales bacterium]
MRKINNGAKFKLLCIASLAGVILLIGVLSVAPVIADHCANDEIHVSVGLDGENCVPRGDDAATNPIIVYLGWIIRFLAGGVGLVIALMITVGGVQYITSSGNPEGMAHAKKRITEAFEALLLFIFMAAILNFVIPGGIL